MAKNKFINFDAIKEPQQRVAKYDDAVAYKKLFFHFFFL